MDAQTARPRGCTNFKLHQLLRSVARQYDAELAKAGLKGTQYSLLSHIDAFGPVMPKTLAQKMRMDASTLTRNLKVLIDEGWVVQLRGTDARSRLVELTPAGQAKRELAKPYWKRAQTQLNDRLGPERVAALHLLMDDAIERLGEVEA